MVASVRWVFQVSQVSVDRRDIIEVRCKTSISLCSKFIQETAYQILLEWPEFCRRYYKKQFGLFFSGHTKS